MNDMETSAVSCPGFLAVSGIEKKWPDAHVSFSVSVPQGQMLGILGQSGSGKSTVLRMIAGLLTPDAGSVWLDGRDITHLAPGKRRVGMVFQNHALFSHLRVDDNIGYGLVSAGMSKKESRIRAAEFLERFGLSGFEKRWPDSLSGGEAQRVALARTLIVQPLLVLFDEPLSSLDAPLRRRLRKEIRSGQKELGCTGILVTHDIEEALAVSDMIVVMKQGNVIWQGLTADFPAELFF